MAFSRRENVIVSALLLPAGIAVPVLLLWGFRGQIDLKDPLMWIFQIVWIAVLLSFARSGKRSEGSSR